MQGKKIVIVSNTTWNIHNFRLNIIRKLIDEGNEVIVVAPIDEFIHYKKQFKNLLHFPLRKLDRDSINPLKDLKLMLELKGIYAKLKPDFIIHYTVKPNIYGGIAANQLGIPSIAVVTGLGYAFIHNGFIKKITKILYRYSNRFHRKVIFENDTDRQLFEDEKLIRPEQGISVKGCGVDTRYFAPTKARSTDQDKIIFTFIGRLLYDKGVKEFIEAAHFLQSKISHAEFWMVGEIDKENPSAIKEDDLVEWMKGANIRYHGSTKDVKKYISLSDCIVLPSYREGMSRIIMEGMSMEKPIITTDTPGCRETVDEGKNGFVVPVRDSRSLALAMQKMDQLTPLQRADMGRYGRQKAIAEFDEAVIANHIFNILEEVM